MKSIWKRNIALLILVSLTTVHCHQPEPPAPPYPLRVIEIDMQQAALTADRIRKEVGVEIADGLELSLWASDSLITDPIAISADGIGGIYYTNGSRLQHSEFDIRGHRDWMTESMSFQTVEDRRAFLRKTFAPQKSTENVKQIEDLNHDGSHDWRDLTVEKESVWRLEDRDGDGVADRTQLYIEDFHEEISDLANGVEYGDDHVYVAVGPDLWRTKDIDGDGIADEKESLAHGFAVHIGFGAHGMSGVKMGPDGRIWWGIGDIGMNLVDRKGKRWKYPNQGVIVRCEPDGSKFEVFAAGLRNTHEFVFDQFGNLISEDNDGDHTGERERLVYITNGSDGGWRINWQFGKYTDPDNNRYKVWMDEKMNVPRWKGQAAYITPPIINYVNGPTGMVYNPGTALGGQWKNHFFIAEFRGSPANSPIHAFTLRPVGASFALDHTQEVVKGLLPTGMDFGPDGALYFSDWIDGWGIKDRGRLWKLDVPIAERAEIREHTRAHLAADFSKKTDGELGELLAFTDMRVRQKAQFELVKRNDEGMKVFMDIATLGHDQLARIHALWGMAQMARRNQGKASHLTTYLDDKDPEIQAQAAKMIGDVKYADAEKHLIGLLQHPSLRVQFFAAEALGRTHAIHAVQPLIDMLIGNDDKDAWLRHAGALALARIGDAQSLVDLRNHPSRAARIAAVVALRRMQDQGIAVFLKDTDEYIVTEAARGIHDDFSIESALPALAQLLATTSFTNEALIRRAISANLRLGEPENLTALKSYIFNTQASAGMRAEALAALSTWAKPSVLDRVDGRYRGIITRDSSEVREVLEEHLEKLLQDKSSMIAVAAIEASARLDIQSTGASILKLIQSNSSKDLNLAGIRALQKMQSPHLSDALRASLRSKNSEVRAEALALLPESNISDGDAELLYRDILKNGSVKERQAAMAGLTELESPAATILIKQEFDKLVQGTLGKELWLDVLDAAESKPDAYLRNGVAKYTATFADDPLAEFQSTLSGGDAVKGQRIFSRHEGAQCTRCHSIWEWGGDAGPNLMGVGDRLIKEKILESLIMPSAVLAPGYEVTSVTLKDETVVAGIVAEETEAELKIKVGKDNVKTVSKSQIINRDKIPSAMPPVKSILSKREIRDLVAFLSGLKGELEHQ